MKYRRIIQTREGGLQVVEDEMPHPGPGEVRVRILAAGVSFADILMREGVHPEARRGPYTPGWDVVGDVDEVGEGATSVAVGQRVAALPIAGGYAESICLPETEFVRVPEDVDPAEAVCLVLNYTTAYQMLHRSAKAQPGESALVHSAAGGVGSALLELCRLHGVTTYGTASQSKFKVVEELGGIPIDYHHVDFVRQVRESTERGVDIAFDGIGGWNLVRSFKTLASGGRLVAYGLISSLVGGKRSVRRVASDAAGWATAFAQSLVHRKKRFTIYSIQMLKRRHPDWFHQDMTALYELLEQRKIQPITAERLPLEQAALAHQRLTERTTVGKIVLLCD